MQYKDRSTSQKIEKWVNVFNEGDMIYKALPEKVLKALDDIDCKIIDVGHKGGIFAIFATEIKGDLLKESRYLPYFQVEWEDYYQENKQYYDPDTLSIDDLDEGNLHVLSDFGHVRVEICVHDEITGKLFMEYEDLYYLIWQKDRDIKEDLLDQCRGKAYWNSLIKHNDQNTDFKVCRLKRLLKAKDEELREKELTIQKLLITKK